MPKAFERALQAQQRDVVRYHKVRRGDVQPRRHRFETGSYVYVAQPPLNTMDVRTACTILRVVEILESGWLRLLSGSDGNEIHQVHMDNCAPCHLSNLVPARYGRAACQHAKVVAATTLQPHDSFATSAKPCGMWRAPRQSYILTRSGYARTSRRRYAADAAA
eukprot:jgi/Tetstr1/460008/TSEL_005329.t1